MPTGRHCNLASLRSQASTSLTAIRNRRLGCLGTVSHSAISDGAQRVLSRSVRTIKGILGPAIPPDNGLSKISVTPTAVDRSDGVAACIGEQTPEHDFAKLVLHGQIDWDWIDSEEVESSESGGITGKRRGPLRSAQFQQVTDFFNGRSQFDSYPLGPA